MTRLWGERVATSRSSLPRDTGRTEENSAFERYRPRSRRRRPHAAKRCTSGASRVGAEDLDCGDEGGGPSTLGLLSDDSSVASLCPRRCLRPWARLLRRAERLRATV